MLTPADAILTFQSCKNQLGIPPSAELYFVEKRMIEYSDADALKAEPTKTSAPEGGKPAIIASANQESGNRCPPAYKERIVWIGCYSDLYLRWELALDDQGKLIRVRP